MKKTMTIHANHKTQKSANAAIEMGFADGTFDESFPPYVFVESEDNFLIVTDVIEYCRYAIHYSSDAQSFYWEHPLGNIGGEGFDSVDQCKEDIDYYRDQLEKFNRGPFAN